MINQQKFVREVTSESIVTLGVYGAIAHKLVADLDAGLIGQVEAELFIYSFKEREKVDLVDYM